MEVDITVPLSSLSFGAAFLKDGVAHSVANTSGGMPAPASGNVWAIELPNQTPIQIASTIEVIPLPPLKVVYA